MVAASAAAPVCMRVSSDVWRRDPCLQAWGGSAVPPFVLSTFRFCLLVAELRTITRDTASNAPRAGDSGGIGYQAGEMVGASGALTGRLPHSATVNRPPDANQVGMCGNLSTGIDSTPEGTA